MIKRRRGPAPQSDRFTVAVPIAVGRLVRQRAVEWDVTPSAAAAKLLEEATRVDVEHQHAALVEATVERVLRAEFGRLDALTTRAALQAYQGRWLVARLLALVPGLVPEPSELQLRRAVELNRDGHRKAVEWLDQRVPNGPMGDP